MKYEWKKDCKSFISRYPCDTLKANKYKSCNECRFYDPYSEKILIIKLGARGDVLRTTCILKPLRKKYSNPHITWLVKEESKPLLENNFLIDKILIYNQESILRLAFEKFDVVYCLEIDTPSTLLANLVNANKKYGYYFDKFGHTSAFNKPAESYLNKALSDHLKKLKQTYQEMIFKVAEIPYNKEIYILNLTEKEKNFSKEFMKKHNLKETDKILGINMGSAPRWPSKKWANEKILEFIKKVDKETNYKIILLCGPNEKRLQKKILNNLKKSKIKIITNNPDNTMKEFIATVNICDTIITSDTLTLHVAIALKKKIIALFFCTPPYEIEDHSLIKKITSPLLEKYMLSDELHEDLINSISVEEVLKTLKSIN
jgi:heptosyltransferase-2